jgi:phosphate transport system substrate-binding protein
MAHYRRPTIESSPFFYEPARTAVPIGTARGLVNALGWLLVATSSAAVACSKDDGVVRIDGSSTVFPIMSAVGVEFQKADLTKVAVGVSGTIGGFRKFCAGETDITGASRPITSSESELCRQNGVEYIEVPIAYDGLSVLVNQRNDWARDITTAELKKMWEPAAQGTVTHWNQIRPGWPDKELHLYGAGVDSGTYDYFTEAIVGTQHSSRKDFISSEDDDVLVKDVAGDELGLGFFGYMYYAKNKDKLKVLALDDENPSNGAGPIAPSPETVRSGTYQPLSRPLFVYVAEKALARPQVASFMNFYLERGWKLVGQVGYVSLPANAYALGIARVSARTTGSLFGGQGSQIGVSVADLLQKETTAKNQ